MSALIHLNNAPSLIGWGILRVLMSRLTWRVEHLSLCATASILMSSGIVSLLEDSIFSVDSFSIMTPAYKNSI
jgi:hypothetical protein